MRNAHSQILFDQATEQLQQAQELLKYGRYGEAERLAYQASDSIAASYMARLGGEEVPSTEKTSPRDGAQNDNIDGVASIKAFQKFVKNVWRVGATPEENQDIRGIVGDVVGLREAHDWSVLDEIAKDDAKLMLQRVSEMLEIVKGLI